MYQMLILLPLGGITSSLNNGGSVGESIYSRATSSGFFRFVRRLDSGITK